MKDERTGVELLREAAKLMRERANAIHPDRPWWDVETLSSMNWRWRDQPAYNSGIHSFIDEDIEHIASWHPAVALAVADWLDNEADSWDDDEADMAYYHPYLVARAYLSPTEPRRCGDGSGYICPGHAGYNAWFCDGEPE